MVVEVVMVVIVMMAFDYYSSLDDKHFLNKQYIYQFRQMILSIDLLNKIPYWKLHSHWSIAYISDLICSIFPLWLLLVYHLLSFFLSSFMCLGHFYSF